MDGWMDRYRWKDVVACLDNWAYLACVHEARLYVVPEMRDIGRLARFFPTVAAGCERTTVRA